jgi:hypothetical protein
MLAEVAAVMKLEARQVRFVLPFLPVSRHVRLIGKHNSIQLLETALVVEGNRLKLHYFGLERFMGAAMSEWTTITVPYSRIVAAKLQRFLVVRLVLGALVLADLALFIVAAVKDSQELGTVCLFLTLTLIVLGVVLAVGRLFSDNFGWMMILLAVITCAFPGGLLIWLPWLVSSRYVIEYRNVEGQRRRFMFRFLSKKTRLAFEQQLQRNRDLARDLQTASVMMSG